jgi:hypothetical protein
MRQLLLFALGVCLASAAADAQEGGGIVIFGGGTGSATIMCRACTHAGNMGGSTLSMQFVEQVSQHLRVGGTADWWWHERDTWMRGIWDVTAAVFYYPGTLRRGFYVEGGPTYSMILASVDDSTALQRHGWGIAAGIGYDLSPRSSVSLTPYLRYSYAWVGDVYYPIDSGIPFARGWKHEFLSCGLGITLHVRR